VIAPLPIASEIAASDNWWMLGVTVLLFPLMYASLGISTLPGKQGIDQTSRFKAQLRSLQKKPDGVSLLTVTHAQPYGHPGLPSRRRERAMLNSVASRSPRQT
jgi:hypothetical protein